MPSTSDTPKLPAQGFLSDDPAFPARTILGTLFIGAFLGYLNETLLNVALTRLMTEFAVGKTTVQWISTGFLLIMGAFTPLTAGIMQWFNTRTITLVTLGVFLTGSLICAAAPSFGVLLAGRLVQAVAAAFSVPLLMNAILAIYPPNRRGMAMALVAVIFTVAPAIGPTISGVVTDHLGWRYLFLLTVPFTLLAMLLAACTLKRNLTLITRPPIDLLSVLLSIAGFGGLVYTASQFSSLPPIIFVLTLLLSLLTVALFAWRQFRLESPLLDLRALLQPQYRYTIIIVSLAYFLFMGFELLLPMHALQVLLLSGTVTGFMLMPASIAEAVAAPIFGALLDRKGGRAVALPCGILMVLSTTAMWLYLDASSSPAVISVIFSAFVISVAAAIAGETHGLNHLPRALHPHGTAIINTVTPIAGALGAAFFVGIARVGETLSGQADARLAMQEGFRLSVGVMAILSLIALFYGLKVRPDAGMPNRQTPHQGSPLENTETSRIQDGDE